MSDAEGMIGAVDPDTAATPTAETPPVELAWGDDPDPGEVSGASWRMVAALAASICITGALLITTALVWSQRSASDLLTAATTPAPTLTQPPPPSATTVVAPPPVTVTITPPPAAPAPAAAPAPRYSRADSAFLSEAHAAGTVSTDGDDDTIDLAHVVCGDPADGLTLRDEAAILQRSTGWSIEASSRFVYLAVIHYCPNRGR